MIICTAHFIIDYIRTKIDSRIESQRLRFLTFIVDQVLHVTTIIVAYYLSGSGFRKKVICLFISRRRKQQSRKQCRKHDRQIGTNDHSNLAAMQPVQCDRAGSNSKKYCSVQAAGKPGLCGKISHRNITEPVYFAYCHIGSEICFVAVTAIMGLPQAAPFSLSKTYF